VKWIVLDDCNGIFVSGGMHTCCRSLKLPFLIALCKQVPFSWHATGRCGFQNLNLIGK